MRHNFYIKGFAFFLRPVEIGDAEFIVQIRNKYPERVRYIHPILPDVKLQREWISRYLDRNNDYYWVIGRLDTNQAEGLIGVYDLNSETQTAEWGRWILLPDSLAAIESVLLLYKLVFESLKLESLYCLTVGENAPVLSFHDSCGLPRADLLEKHFMLGDKLHDAVKHLCSRDTWPAVRLKLEPKAQAIAKRILSQG